MNLPILYSFRRCPYAMRARAAIFASGINVELREIELRDKPEEMLAASPKGSVPVLVLPDGTVIDESWDIMLWALQRNDTYKWLGNDGDLIGPTLPLLEENDTSFKDNLDCYKYPERQPERSQTEHREAGEEFLQILEQRLEVTPFLLGARFTVADVVVLPFVRQFVAVDTDWFEQAPYPALREWLARYLEADLFTKVMEKFPVWTPGQPPILFGYQTPEM